MVETKEVILALGSNKCHDDTMATAKGLLKHLLHDIRFSSEAWTDPINIISGPFLNCVAVAHTDLGYKAFNKALKQIEHECGDRPSLRKENNLILMDIDILQFGDQKWHLQDWQRPYIQQMIRELTEEEPTL